MAQQGWRKTYNDGKKTLNKKRVIVNVRPETKTLTYVPLSI